MDAQKVDMYLMSHSKYYESHNIAVIRDMMLRADDNKLMAVMAVNLKDPTAMVIYSVVVGVLGIDRFMLGDVGLGVLKLLTCGGLYIWFIVDWFMVVNRAKEINYENLMRALM